MPRHRRNWHYRRGPAHVIFSREAALRRLAAGRGWPRGYPRKDVADAKLLRRETRTLTTWLHEQRLNAVLGVVEQCRARTVLDLGCGEGDLLVRLAARPRIERIVGLDPCRPSLARLRARLAALGAAAGTARIALVHGSLMDAGAGFTGFDCAVLSETIEHIDPDRLALVERAVFARLRPAAVAVTTPNAEFNALLGVPAHRLRHRDHRFEWGRARFRRWACGVAARNGYDVVLSDIAGSHPRLGGASQMAVFAGARPRRAAGCSVTAGQ